MTKLPKQPPLTARTKLLSFDIESNGLHGEAFAVGAVVMDRTGKVYDSFAARTPIIGETDEWVADNVLPAIKSMSVTHGSVSSMRESFWQWYLRAEPTADYVLVNNGYPVEYRFLLQCQEGNLEERYWQHPFPILELSSLLLQLGGDAAAGKSHLVAEVKRTMPLSLHHPVDDAKLAVMVAFKAFQLADRIP